MIKLTSNQLYTDLILTQPLSAGLFSPRTIAYFDKDGFELTPIELAIYSVHRIPINNHLYHSCNQVDWYKQDPDTSSGLILDHSLLLHRFGFGGELRAEIEECAKRYPVLNKLLYLVPKWGVDFSLDYADEKGILEVVHVEYDSRHREEVVAVKNYMENWIDSIDWDFAVAQLRARRAEWINLKGDAQNDWKAAFFGFDKAEQKEKAW